MVVELQLLALMALLLAFAWLPASICAYRTYGLRRIFSNRTTAGLPPLPDWGRRCELAHHNLLEIFPVYVVATLLLALNGGFTAETGLVAAVFVAAQVVHFAAYGMGVAWARLASWALGLGAVLYLLGMAVRGLVTF